jgi:hypothetical protein
MSLQELSSHTFSNKDVSPEALCSSIGKHGFAVINNFISKPSAACILLETALPLANVNHNGLGPALHGDTQYFTNIIAHSKLVHDIITSSFVLDLCSSYLGEGHQLVNNRIQTTRTKIAMPWHTDNNLLKDGRLVGRHELPGLQFGLYLTDVGDSPFQLISNSESWSLDFSNQYLIDDDIKAKELTTKEIFPATGTLLILNTHVFHRAAPLRDSAYTRSILLFQVDKTSNKYPNHGEKLIVQPEFFKDFNPAIVSLLGFGQERAYPAFPETSIDTLNLKQLIYLQKAILTSFPRTVFRKFLKTVLPASFVVSIKNLLVSKSKSKPSPNTSDSNPYLEN